MTTAVPPQSLPRHYLNPPGPFHLTLLIFWGSLGLVTLTNVGHFGWGWPAWIAFGSNVVALHIAGTVIHEASHNAAHPNRIVNAILGHSSALMLGFAFPVFTRVHLQHHARVNDPENDPDHIVSTAGPIWLIAPRFFYHEIFFFRRRLWRKLELWEWALSRLFLVIVIGVCCSLDVINALMNFWFVPALITGTIYGLFFDYFPHRPFQQQGRWHNARIYANPVINILIMGQNYHLIHHLWPSMPWYRAQSAYYDIKPLLDSKGSCQTFGVFDDFQNFRSFLYDVFLGVTFETAVEPQRSQAQSLYTPNSMDALTDTETPGDAKATVDPPNKILVGAK